MEHTTSSDPGDKRRSANRRNSQLSTGPKTEPGKQASAQNALKFGFFSTKALLPGESWEEFVTFRESWLRQFCPRNSMEEHLLEQYIPLAWRLRRLPEIEAFAFTRYGISLQGNQCGPGFALVASVQTDNILGQLSRYEATLSKRAFKYLELFWSLRKDSLSKELGATRDAPAIDLPPDGPAPTGTSADAGGTVPTGTEDPATQGELPKEPGV